MATKTTSTVTKTELPEWYNQYAQNVLSKAYQATSEPYQAYGAPRIAGFAPEQEQAFQSVKENVGAWQPYMGAATQAAGQGMQSFTAPGVAQQYMNPYIQQVVAGIGQTAGRNLYENILPKINRTFVGGGTFGGSRSAEFTNRAIRDTQAQALSAQIDAMSKGYDTAANLYGTEASRALTGAGVLSGLGEQYQSQAGKEAAGLEAVGQQRQGLAQSSADLAYQDFLRQQQYPLQQVQNLAGIGSTLNLGGGTQTQTATAPGPSSTAQTLGTVAGIAGTLGSIFAKDGGEISPERAKKKKPAKAMKQGLGWLKEAA